MAPDSPSLRRIRHLPRKYHANRQSSRTKKEALPDLRICYAEALARYQEAAKETQVGFFRCFEKRGWKLMSVWFCRVRWMLLRSMLRLTRPSIMLSGVWTILQMRGQGCRASRSTMYVCFFVHLMYICANERHVGQTEERYCQLMLQKKGPWRRSRYREVLRCPTRTTHKRGTTKNHRAR